MVQAFFLAEDNEFGRLLSFLNFGHLRDLFNLEISKMTLIFAVFFAHEEQSTLEGNNGGSLDGPCLQKILQDVTSERV